MRVVIVREPGAHRDRLREVVLGTGLECAAGDCVTLAELPVRLTRGPAGLVVVGLGPDPSGAVPLVQQIAAQARVPVFAVGPSWESQDILQALRGGAREYLHEEHFRNELLAALAKLRQAGNVGLQWGKLLAVTGARPGTGVTTVACNLAFALAANSPGAVVLAELGDSVPELALDLDLQPPHDLAELAGNWQRLDATLLRRALVDHPAKLSVLAHRPETLTPAAPEAPAMRQLLVLLRTMFSFTVLDLGHGASAANREALTLADAVVFVMRLDVPSVRLSRRVLRRFEDWSLPQAKLTVVANRYGQRREFPWKKAQEALGLPIADWIPDDPASVNYALNHGRPLIQTARWAAITRRFLTMAVRLESRAHGRAG